MCDAYCGGCHQNFTDKDNVNSIDLYNLCAGCYIMGENKTGEVLIKDRVKVEWVELGEGWSGDYNSDDPGDEELLRFDVSWLNDSSEWIDPGDVSYCTRFPAKATIEQKQRGLELLMSAFYEPLMAGHSAKKIGEEMSWIGPDWLLRDECPFCHDTSVYYDGGDCLSKDRICNTCGNGWTERG